MSDNKHDSQLAGDANNRVGDDSKRPRFKQVHVIINPASGSDEPILNTLNTVFNDLNIEWDAFVTKKAGDATRYARKAAESGVDVVAVYGGDGTVLEVASGLVGSKTPLVILPGGTANVLSVELGIPRALAEAAALLGNPTAQVRSVDMGQVGDQYFFHLGLGIEGQMIHETDREAKDSSGLFAYVKSILKTMRNPPVAKYHLLMDGEQVEVEGVNCMVTNFGSIGVAGLKLAHTIDMSDGLMDVIVLQEANLSTLASAAAGAVTSGEVATALLQWQAREVTIVADPPQTATLDGEVIELHDIAVRVVPGAVRILVPAPAEG